MINKPPDKYTYIKLPLKNILINNDNNTHKSRIATLGLVTEELCSSVGINRDLNAVLNMVKIVKNYLKHKERPNIFKRMLTQQKQVV